MATPSSHSSTPSASTPTGKRPLPRLSSLSGSTTTTATAKAGQSSFISIASPTSSSIHTAIPGVGSTGGLGPKSVPILLNQGRSYQSFHMAFNRQNLREGERLKVQEEEEDVIGAFGGGVGSWTEEEEQIREGTSQLANLSLIESQSSSSSLSSPSPIASTSPSHPTVSNLTLALQHQNKSQQGVLKSMNEASSTSTLAVAGKSGGETDESITEVEHEGEDDTDADVDIKVKLRGLPPIKANSPPVMEVADEQTALLERKHVEALPGRGGYGAIEGGGLSGTVPTNGSGVIREGLRKNNSSEVRSRWKEITKKMCSVKRWKGKLDWRLGVQALPAVLLGTLMNVLDGVSYGLITFPTNIPLFANFGGIGVSMFFVSCIISQLVYTLGGSTFVGGNGSMMIEVVPFLHNMVDTIIRACKHEDEVVPTTMVAFALSSILTGITFWILGAAKLGTLIGFFPRSVLIGCIGGVGAFLFITGLEVSARLEGESVEFSMDTVRHFFELSVLPLWTVPLALAGLLRIITVKYHHPLIFTGYFLVIPVFFYIITLIIGTPLETLREKGWVFELEGVDTPFYEYWTYFDGAKTNIPALLETLPTQFALVFFALLHVPINVPSLGISIGEDNVDTDRELRAHGVSNFLSGLAGSVPNYLCYVNSVLFYRVGGDSRFAGVLLATASFGVLIAGPKVIGYLPVMVVGALIYVLGFDLMKEALWDTWGRVAAFEYFTIVAIVVVMTLWDFVVGIGAGIILACISFVITASQGPSIRAVMNGATARSTVRRHPKQHAFLKQVGTQTKILKLQGFLFFGTISKCEATMRGILDHSEWTSNPVRFLVLDFTLASGVDFSAAEAFLRIKRQLDSKGVVLVFCGTKPDSPIGQALRSVGLWGGEGELRVQVYATLNDALEQCENEYLRSLYSSGFLASKSTESDFQSIAIDVPPPPPSDNNPLADFSFFGQSPRHNHLKTAAQENLQISNEGRNLMKNFAQPLPLLLLSLKPYARQLDQNYFSRLVPLFERVVLKRGELLWEVNSDANAFYVIETGILRAMYSLLSGSSDNSQSQLTETMVPGTVAGEFTFLSNIKRTVKVVADRDTVVWKMSRLNWDKLGTNSVEDQTILTQILLRCAQEEQEVLMTHLATSFRWPEM